MMTWKEIKERIEALGITDDDKIAYIDIDGYVSELRLRYCGDTKAVS